MAKTVGKFLSGKKTNLGLIGLGILGICFEMGWISEHLAVMLGMGLGSLTGVSARQAYKKGK